jgi:hypothetical protein
MVQDPSSIFSSSLFQANTGQAMDATSRKMNAMGYQMSGNEMAALNTQAQGKGLDYFNTMTSLLSNLAGVGMNPAGGSAMATQQNQENWGAIGEGLQGIGGLFNNDTSNGSTTMNQGGYDPALVSSYILS